MIQNVVLHNSRRQSVKICPIQINILSKLQKSLQDKLCTTHMTPGPQLQFVQVQICYPRHMRSKLIHCRNYQNIDTEERYANSCPSNTVFETYLSSMNATSRISSG
jgi:hypothetical protein